MSTAIARKTGSGTPATIEIGTYDLNALAEAFEVIRKPSKTLASTMIGGRDLLDALKELEIDGVPYLQKILSKLSSRVDRWIEARRFRDASWMWLNPTRDAASMDPVEFLAVLTEKLSLSPTGQVNDEVCRRLKMVCDDLADQHPSLARHITARVADLQFVACRNDRRAMNLGEPFMLLAELLYIQGRALSELDPDDAGNAGGTTHDVVSSAEKLVRTILMNVCGLVTTTLSGDSKGANPPTFNANANIMVPIRLGTYDERSLTERLEKYKDLSAFSRARQLWAGFERRQVKRIFVVVSDTTGDADDPRSSNYLGFWIPDIQDRGDRVIPGAPEAFKTVKAQRLIRNDLPHTFPVGDDQMEREWREYMMGVGPAPFNESMCLSIPLVRDNKPVAVVNVNAYSDKIWPRLLSPSWRTLVQEDLAAWHALLLPALRGVRDAEERVRLAPSLRTPF